MVLQLVRSRCVHCASSITRSSSHLRTMLPESSSHPLLAKQPNYASPYMTRNPVVVHYLCSILNVYSAVAHSVLFDADRIWGSLVTLSLSREVGRRPEFQREERRASDLSLSFLSLLFVGRYAEIEEYICRDDCGKVKAGHASRRDRDQSLSNLIALRSSDHTSVQC